MPETTGQAARCEPYVDIWAAGRYPFVPACTCGWRAQRGYMAEHAAQLVADAHRDERTPRGPAQLAVYQPEGESWQLVDPHGLGELLADAHHSGLSLVGEIYLLPATGGAPQRLTLQHVASKTTEDDHMLLTCVLVNDAGEEHAEHVYVRIDARA